ncbi:GNAT family N-acetyltransferase [Bacillus sp. FJAT-28004]|uniref:GNAT family N-acetyltransferase n=1 Tax=Bacillus sp. FJAT-28004 TaxID=1679165 RepID=UPI0006B43D08|nr:GNAT family N-acetyltransferase [Bacillus sp. FJAT-28004]
MKLPFLSKELAKRIQQSEIEYLTSRISSIGERPGNPEGVEINQYGQTVAYYIKTMPWGIFNSVKGLGDEDNDKLVEIIEFYDARDRGFQIDLNPTQCSAKLFGKLAELDFRQNGFHSVLYGLPREDKPILQPNITISEVVTEEEFDHYAEIHCLGSGMSLSYKHHFVNNNIGLLNRKGWKIFLGYLNGIPAGVGVMYISEDGIASCALAATAPSFRNQGLQTALISRRLHEAHLAGCELVVAQASFGSTSQHNMERAGLHMAWTRSIMTR